MTPASSKIAGKPPKDQFSFKPEMVGLIEEHIKKYPDGLQASAVLPLLDLAQRQCDGWLPQPAIEEVARLLGMASIRVYEIASFYTMFNLKPVGKFHVQVCGTTPCWLRGAEAIRHACEQKLGIETGKGQITQDGLFSLSEVECLGACVNAPVIQINDDYYEDLTPEAIGTILTELSEGKKRLPGSVCGRQASAPQQLISDALAAQPIAQAAPKRTRRKTKGDDQNAS